MNIYKQIFKQIKKYDVTLPVAFDWEDFSDYNSYKLSFYNLTSMADGFIEEIEKNVKEEIDELEDEMFRHGRRRDM